MMYSDLTGQQLGDYRLLSLVGHGSFASVYLGQNVYIEGLKVAVKVIHAPLSDKARSDFYKEAQVLTLLKHPHIVPILGFGVTQNTPYIITEYAPNGTLYEYMSKTPGAPEEIAPVIKQIAEGLYAAHQKKFVHRDIKPRNILFGADNQILISDFGLAVVAWDSLRSSLHKSLQVHFSGTPLYMAPEQWKSKPVPASDQYSLAVIVYQWLCGETPFRGNILPQLMFQHERQLPAPLCEKVPHLPREIDRVVLKALEKEPRQRCATVLEFAEAFSKACPQPVSLGKTALMSPQTPSSPAPPTQLPYPNPPSAAPAAQRAVASVPSVPSSTGSGSSLRSISRRGMLVGLGLSLGAAATYLTIKALTPVKGAGSTSPTPTPRPPAGASPIPTEVQRGGIVYTLRHDGPIYRVAWSPDGQYLATSTWKPDHTVRVWDKKTLLASFTGHTATVTDVTWSPDGRRIASSGGIGDNTVCIWDPLRGDATPPESKYKIPLPPLMNSARAVAWSPDGKQLAIGGGLEGHDFNIYIYDSVNHQVVSTLSGHKDTINSLAWRPPQGSDNDQYLASASDDYTVGIWKPSTGESWSLKGHQDHVYAVAWSPDGQYLATGAAGSKDHTVQVWKWNKKDKTSIYTHDSHTDAVYAVTWSPDSAYIASASADKTVHVYDAQGDGGFYSYPDNRGIVHAAAWQPQASLIASGDNDVDMYNHYYVRVWQALPT